MKTITFQWFALFAFVGMAIAATTSKIHLNSVQASATRDTNQVAQSCVANARVERVGLSSDGKYVAASWSNGTAKIWDSTTGQALQTFVGDSQDGIVSIVFSPDNKYVLTGAMKAAVLWDALKGTKLRAFPR